MARPVKAVVEYFPHECNQSKELTIICSRFNNDGYAFYFTLFELLGRTEHHYYSCRKKIDWEFLLSITHVNGDIAVQILDLLVEVGEIDEELWKQKVIRSQKFIDSLNTLYQRRRVSVLDKTAVMSFCTQKPLSTAFFARTKTHNVCRNPQSKVEYSIVKERERESTEIKDSPPGGKKRERENHPPKLEEVKNFFKENDFLDWALEAETFFYFWNEKEWKRDGRSISWKNNAHIWNARSKKFTSQNEAKNQEFKEHKESRQKELMVGAPTEKIDITIEDRIKSKQELIDNLESKGIKRLSLNELQKYYMWKEDLEKHKYLSDGGSETSVGYRKIEVKFGIAKRIVYLKDPGKKGKQKKNIRENLKNLQQELRELENAER
ncbi:MAG: DUF4373 domain-containing protein [Candidatus Aminicenantes bacterium]|nr:DUF4373 domain-containing protein [Candidatus Aminicenantes bacterium]